MREEEHKIQKKLSFSCISMDDHGNSQEKINSFRQMYILGNHFDKPTTHL